MDICSSGAARLRALSAVPGLIKANFTETQKSWLEGNSRGLQSSVPLTAGLSPAGELQDELVHSHKDKGMQS